MRAEQADTSSDAAWFAGHLRTALTSLYDPSVLRASPLAEVFGMVDRIDRVSAVRRSLVEGIESLRPSAGTPQGSRTWRVYQVLRRRYTEQLSQRRVAADLGLSIRQLQREEKLAREVLADHLWAVHELEETLPALAFRLREADHHALLASASTGARTQELEKLRESVPVQMTDVGAVIHDVLETARPMVQSSGMSIDYVERGDLPSVFLQVPFLRQALLNLVVAATHCAPGGKVFIECEHIARQLRIRVWGVVQPLSPPPRSEKRAESLRMAEQLIALCQGTLEIAVPTDSEVTGGAPDTAFSATVVLPLADQTTVLVIDDNADTLRLVERYLSGSRYRFLGALDARQGLALAEASLPQIIVLDVMMPGEDGWTLLGSLREHPETHRVPVVVCTILSQEELALALGAAEFIRKPVSRGELLSALDRQLGQRQKASC